MSYRYCPDCGEWHRHTDLDINEYGALVCPHDGHPEVHATIEPNWTTTARELRAHLPRYHDDRDEMIQAAIDQGIVEL